MMNILKIYLPQGTLVPLASSALALSWVILVQPLTLAVTFDFDRALLNPNPANDDLFGHAVAVSGNHLLVGALGDDEDDDAAMDVAYLFDITTGSLTHTFSNPTPPANNPFGDQFGFAVAIDGNNAIVGAPMDDDGNNSGAAYLFDAISGDLLQTFLDPNPSNNSEFGHSVAVNGNRVLVGTPSEDTGAPNTGAAHLFDVTTGDLLHTFNNPTPEGGDLFGDAVALEGDRVLIGAFLDDEGEENSGAAHLFDATTGDFLQTFSNPTPARGDVFGSALAISGNTIAIGARADDEGANNSGVVHLFDATTGDFQQTITNPTPDVGDVFGVSLTAHGNTLLVGAIADDEGASNSGAAHVFDLTTGELLQTLNNPTPEEGDLFGNGVAFEGDRAIVAAFGADDGGENTGAVYVFETASSQKVPEPGVVLGSIVVAGSALKWSKRKHRV